ncbi:MAG: LysR family transcriptional regulator [Pseudomonadota bacterium]
MDTRLLDYFLRVAELGSINKAATDLYLSQPALSRHIALLEHELNVKLFNRNQGGVKLTEAGKLLCERARKILLEISILKGHIGEHAIGQLALGIPPSWQSFFTTPLVQTIVSQFPGIMLRVHEGPSNVMRDQMLRGMVDLAIVPFDSTPAAGYRQTLLIREPMILVGALDAGLKMDEPVPISRLDGIEFVLPGSQNVLRTQLENALLRKNYSFRLTVEVDSLTLCLDMARKGIAYTVIPACALSHNHLADTVSIAPIQNMYMTWTLYENEARSHSQAVRQGRSLILGIIDERLAEGKWFGAERAGI